MKDGFSADFKMLSVQSEPNWDSFPMAMAAFGIFYVSLGMHGKRVPSRRSKVRNFTKTATADFSRLNSCSAKFRLKCKWDQFFLT